jgi:hypothetical protein
VGALITTIAAMIVGGAVASATVFGLVSSQTANPDKSPVSVNSPAIEYGSNS